MCLVKHKLYIQQIGKWLSELRVSQLHVILSPLSYGWKNTLFGCCISRGAFLKLTSSFPHAPFSSLSSLSCLSNI